VLALNNAAAALTVRFDDGPMGGGTIDNYVISSNVHVINGVLVMVALVATLIWVGRLAITGRPIDKLAVGLVIASEVVLMVQALLGIKLLDQGSGFGQLYIHYIGGLLPVGLFILAGWLGWHRLGQSAKPLGWLVVGGAASAIMAFAIGQAYVDSL
jgi:hypothetical protein